MKNNGANFPVNVSQIKLYLCGETWNVKECCAHVRPHTNFITLVFDVLSIDDFTYMEYQFIALNIDFDIDMLEGTLYSVFPINRINGITWKNNKTIKK